MFIESGTGGGGVTPTPITPSNSSPASMTAGTAYEPTANGYAISSYNNVTPSNSSPVALTSGDIDKMGGSGYAIQSYSSKTPSSTPSSVSSGDIVKMGGSGYLINTYSSITPSSSGAYFSSGMVKMSSSGYAYSSRPSGGASGFSSVSVSKSNSNKTASFSATSGALYIVLLGYHGTSTYSYSYADGASCSGGTASKLSNLSSSNMAGVAGTFYKVVASSSSVSLTTSSATNLAVAFKVT